MSYSHWDASEADEADALHAHTLRIAAGLIELSATD